jgi:membrane-bound serine protease (ClpP class)
VLFVAAVIAAVLWVPSPWSWVLVGVAAVVEIGETGFWVWWNRRRHPRVGVETLVGRNAVVVAPCEPSGQVRIDGELWQAECEEGADVGDTVLIEGVDRLTLLVRRRD